MNADARQFVGECAGEIRDYLTASHDEEAARHLNTLRVLSQDNIRQILNRRLGGIPHDREAWRERVSTAQSLQGVATAQLLDHLRALRNAVQNALKRVRQ